MRPATTKAEVRLSKTQENKRDNKQPIGNQHADNQSKENKNYFLSVLHYITPIVLGPSCRQSYSYTNTKHHRHITIWRTSVMEQIFNFHFLTDVHALRGEEPKNHKNEVMPLCSLFTLLINLLVVYLDYVIEKNTVKRLD